MRPTLETFLIVTIFLLFAMQPRKPKIIYSHINKVFLSMFIIVDFSIGALLLFAELSVYYKFSRNLLTGFAILVITLMVAITLFLFLWSQPFSRKKMGIDDVDEVIQKYRKLDENAVGIMGGWCPDLVVNGKPYKAVIYVNKNKGVGTLAFDLNGNVVRSIELMAQIYHCYHFALEFVNPQQINNRTAQYRRAEKAQKELLTFSENFQKLLDRLQKNSKTELYEHGLKVQKSLEIYKRYNEVLMDIWMNEARWGKDHGNTKVEAVSLDDVEQMEQYWKEKMAWWLGEYKEFQEGLKSARSLLAVMSNEPMLLIPGIRLYLSQLLKFEQTIPLFRAWEEAGEVRDKYNGLTEEARGLWEKRMEWVEQVDIGLAEGKSEDEIMMMSTTQENQVAERKEL